MAKKVIAKQEIKKNVISKVKEKIVIPFAKAPKPVEGKFDFEDKDKVIIVGTGIGLKKDTEHPVAGDMAKRLIHAGKAKFLKVIKTNK